MAKGYGYKKVGFILDRGYFSKGNIRYMDQNEYDFVIMVKGMKDLVAGLVLEKKGIKAIFSIEFSKCVK